MLEELSVFGAERFLIFHRDLSNVPHANHGDRVRAETDQVVELVENKGIVKCSSRNRSDSIRIQKRKSVDYFIFPIETDEIYDHRPNKIAKVNKEIMPLFRFIIDIPYENNNRDKNRVESVKAIVGPPPHDI